MKLTLALLILSVVVVVQPTQAAPNAPTRRWEKMFYPLVEKRMCGKGGRMKQLFKITSRQCRRTYRYAAKYCRRAAHILPFFQVKDRSTGLVWGKWLGSCIGTAFDMKYTYKQPIP